MEDFLAVFRKNQIQNITPMSKWVVDHKERVPNGFVITLFFGLPALRGKEILDDILDTSPRRTSGLASRDGGGPIAIEGRVGKQFQIWTAKTIEERVRKRARANEEADDDGAAAAAAAPAAAIDGNGDGAGEPDAGVAAAGGAAVGAGRGIKGKAGGKGGKGGKGAGKGKGKDKKGGKGKKGNKGKGRG